jgi:member of the syntaxin family of t-SNAREs
MLATLESTRPLFQSYLRIRSTATSASSPELAQARGELEQTLQDLSTDLQDLVESVRAVEKDPFQYGLDVEEVTRRHRLVEDVGKELSNMQQELQQTVALARRKMNGNDGLPEPESFNEGDDGYEAFEQQRQVEIMQEQDEALDDVYHTIGNLREQAHTMGRELEEQGGMLEEVDTIADKVGGKLQGGMQRLNTIIRKNEGLRTPDRNTWC